VQKKSCLPRPQCANPWREREQQDEDQRGLHDHRDFMPRQTP
jgi:hypothetical protein